MASPTVNYAGMHGEPVDGSPARVRVRHPWLTAASFVLLAYALMGKGAGYIGVPPVFIGELLLLAGIASVVLFGTIALSRMPNLLWFVAVFAGWGLVRTVPYISLYG